MRTAPISQGGHQKSNLTFFCYQKKSNKREVKARTSHGNVNSLVQLTQVMTLGMNHIDIEILWSIWMLNDH